MRVLVAPQELKGTLTAVEAAAAIAAGIRRARPGWMLDLCPMSDGGPAFLDAVERSAGGGRRRVAVHDALGRPVEATFLVLDELPGSRAPGPIAVVETAEANGLWRVPEHERDALRAGTIGVGELLSAAVAARPRRLIAGVGGSATSDGGAGMAHTLGARLLNAAGQDLPPGGGALRDLASIEWSPPAAMHGIDIVVATDVTNPLLGPHGAAAVYGPQKGASPVGVEALEQALDRYATVIARDLGVTIGALPGGGAAGGLAAGMVAFLGARLESGFDLIAGVVDLRARLALADVVVTAEGSYDAQSSSGKTTGRIEALAREAGIPCAVFAGISSLPSVTVRTLAQAAGSPERAMRNAASWLAAVAETWATEDVARER